MNKLSKKQQVVLECALDKLYAFLKIRFNVDYDGNIFCIVYEDTVLLTQCSVQDYIAWFAYIALKERKIYLITREVKRDMVYSKRDYNLLYMGSVPTTFTLDF